MAVEPVREMRELLEPLAGVEVVAGAAERIPLPDGSADAVTAAQAFHWFCSDVALREEIPRPAPNPRWCLSGTVSTAQTDLQQLSKRSSIATGGIVCYWTAPAAGQKCSAAWIISSRH